VDEWRITTGWPDFVTLSLGDFDHCFHIADELGTLWADAPVGAALCATGKRRQNFNLYGLCERLLKIFLMGHASIDQYRAELDYPIEAWIRPMLARDSESLSDG
jgi:hypothetical protein